MKGHGADERFCARFERATDLPGGGSRQPRRHRHGDLQWAIRRVAPARFSPVRRRAATRCRRSCPEHAVADTCEGRAELRPYDEHDDLGFICSAGAGAADRSTFITADTVDRSVTVTESVGPAIPVGSTIAVSIRATLAVADSVRSAIAVADAVPHALRVDAQQALLIVRPGLRL
jgi:hypothetical protein